MSRPPGKVETMGDLTDTPIMKHRSGGRTALVVLAIACLAAALIVGI